MQVVIPRGELLESSIELLGRCGGHYICPKDANGKRLGPLAAYTNRYDGVHQWVGDEYIDFAKAEQNGPVLRYIATGLLRKIELGTVAGFCGAPEGGKALATALAMLSDKKYIFPDKRVTAVKTVTSREIVKLAFDRHAPEPGEKWWIVEDVCNNFSTPYEMVLEFERFGAKVEGILCFWNRSMTVGDRYLVRAGLELPVVSVVQKAIPEYRQDDPIVFIDVRENNVAWEPKFEWKRLMQAMNAHRR